MNEPDRTRCTANARVLKAMAHPIRLWILERLAEGERCVCEFADRLPVDFSTVSRHLLVLKQAGLIRDERRGKQVYYHLLAPCVLQFLPCIAAVTVSDPAATDRPPQD